MEYHYKGIWNCDCKCDLEIIRHDDFTVFILTELPDNQGTSVRNWIEHLANSICQEQDIHPLTPSYWIEHYPERPYGAETWDEVLLLWSGGTKGFHSPRWVRIDQADVDKLREGTRIPSRLSRQFRERGE